MRACFVDRARIGGRVVGRFVVDALVGQKEEHLADVDDQLLEVVAFGLVQVVDFVHQRACDDVDLLVQLFEVVGVDQLRVVKRLHEVVDREHAVNQQFECRYLQLVVVRTDVRNQQFIELDLVFLVIGLAVVENRVILD